jgi:hypothetical protein
MRSVVIAAVHEAGHVVVACALGLHCGGAHVDHDGGGGLAATKNPYLLASDLVVEFRHLVPCFRLWAGKLPELAMCARADQCPLLSDIVAKVFLHC